MKIAYINSVYGKGSTGSLVRSMHQYNLKNGIESFVFYGRGKRVKDKNVFKTSCELLSKLNSLRAKFTGMVYSGNYIATLYLINRLKTIKPDIVHIHNLNDQYVNEYILLRYLAKNNIKTVITLHSEQMYTGTCGYTIDCVQWQNGGCKKCPHILLSTGSKNDNSKKAFASLKKCYSLFDKKNLFFISCTPWLENRSKKSLLISSFPNQTIVNGGDISCFYQKFNIDELKIKYGLEKDVSYVLHVNPRIADPIKGYQYIERLSKLLEKNKQIIVVGELPNSYQKIDGIKYFGAVKDKNILSDLYNLCDCIIMLSQRECFPMVIVESLLCGTPVVSFKCGGPDNCFDNSVVTFANYGIIHELSKIVNKLKCNKNAVAEFAKSNLTTDIMCKNYVSFYKRIL